MNATTLPVPADLEARIAALDPRRSFIVQAPAGSGKTELLTQRLLTLLAGVDEPEEIVAITFTRKAAAEMRARVFRAIADVAAGLTPQSAHQQQTYALAQAALARSRERSWALEENPQRLRVLTIDALCMQLTQQMPLSTGFGGQVGVADEPRVLYREAARATLQMLESEGPHQVALQRVLRHFDNRLATLEAQLIALLGRREQWLPVATSGGRVARAELEAALAGIVADALADTDARIPATLRDAWCRSAVHASTQLADEPQALVHAMADGVWPQADAADLPRWLALVELVLKKDDDWRQKIDKRLGFPPGATKLEKAEYGAQRDAHLRVIAELQQHGEPLRKALAVLRSLPAPAYDDAQWEVLQALLDVLRLAAAQLSLVFAQRGEVDFSEIAARAVEALGSDEAPSDLALALDARIRHLLVDEFQDTSLKQYALLRRLCAGWQPDDGRTLFVVGDPMQSIYRFREAEVGLFLDAAVHGQVGDLDSVPLESLQLACNFRSEAGLVDWVNDSFRRVLPVQVDAARGAVPHAPAVPMRAPGDAPAVQIHAQFDVAPREEARAVLQLIEDAQRADPQGTIAVLVRSRTHLDELMPALRAANLRYRAVDLESLASRPVIEDLRALTRALLQPLDRVAMLAVLRAPYCGLRLAELLVFCDALPRELPLLTALRDPSLRARLATDALARLDAVLAVFDAAWASAGRQPLRRWVERTWLALGGPASLREARDLVDAQAYFATLQRFAPGTTLDDADALDMALRDLKAAPDPQADERLSLMTIHKSKGLEFDTVIVPGLGRRTRSSEQAPILLSRRGAGGEGALLLAPVHARGDERDATYAFLGRLDADKQLYENGRLLYVAVTRARRQLHLLGSTGRAADGAPREPAASSLLAQLWPAVAPVYREAAALLGPPLAEDAELASELPRTPPPLRRLVAGWVPPPADSDLALPAALLEASEGFAPTFDWAGELARAVGIVFHRWAQQFAEQGLTVWTPERLAALQARLPAELMTEGVPQARCDVGAERVARALQTLIDDPRGRWLFDTSHREAHSEWALSLARSDGRVQRLVIDRSFVDADGTRWVVDFKTSQHEGSDLDAFLGAERERYRAQLTTYVEALRRMSPGPVRAALYLPLIESADARWQELSL